MFAWRDNFTSYNGPANDPYWTSVSLLLNYEIPSTTYTDGSSNNLPITLQSTPRSNARTPFTGTGASVYFNGSSGFKNTYVSNLVPSGDFTWECWVYMTSLAASQAFIAITPDNNNRVVLQWDSTNGVRFSATYATVQQVNIQQGATTGWSTNTWYHVALVRSGNDYVIYRNGTSVATGTNSYSLGSLTEGISVAYSSGATAKLYLTGFMSNVRAVNGTAVYTTSFTSPTSPLTAITNTVFLVTMTNIGQQNNLLAIDRSVTASGLTLANSPTYSGLSPFFTAAPNIYPGSIKLNGTNQYVQNTTSDGVPVGTGAYTVEGWVRFNSITANVGQTWIEGNRAANGGFFIGLGISNNGSNNGFRIGKSYQADNEYCNFTFSLNTWYHIAHVRSGTTIYFFVNGVQQTTQAGSGGSTGSYSWPSVTTSRWGAGGNAGSVLNYCNGWLSNWRVVNGTALYTSNFTPSTIPLTPITNTVMLQLHQDSGLYDLSNNGNPLVSSQTTQTSVYKYGSQAGLTTSGTTTVTDATNLQFATGDFTIEGWIYRNAAGVVGGIISKGTSTTGWRVRVNASNQLVFATASSDVKTSTTTIAATTWTYFAWTRSGTTNYMFINGTLEGSSFTDSTNFNQTNNLLVGSDGVNTTLQGYMDDVRLTKAVCRYTASFSAPSVPFPTS